ncbi:hypothetical protein RchiOBHm_Chr3g0472741 [Rosa chinensis]|uniref:Uncharacterized protein n=1 Tax=Rosa chinensis TaxID=74649 RepID=A0A2P6RBN7_ROSCH|nr:hypothetical protein RchiOBHm_Chr3g0472741 [Rosa chinensis]
MLLISNLQHKNLVSENNKSHLFHSIIFQTGVAATYHNINHLWEILYQIAQGFELRWWK